MPSDKMPDNEPKNNSSALSFAKIKKLKVGDKFWMIPNKKLVGDGGPKTKAFPNTSFEIEIIGPLTIRLAKNRGSIPVVQYTEGQETVAKSEWPVKGLMDTFKIFLSEEDAQKEIERQSGLN